MTRQINKSQKPKVSIGMPVYNGERFIREAIDSLLAQTFSDFELIISDNCSTDNTENICRQYVDEDSRIKYVRQIDNKGAGLNFEYVLNLANAEFFMWAACDDVWNKNFLSTALELIEKTKVDYIFPTFKLKSIRFHFYHAFDKSMFSFIDLTNVKSRVMQYMNLHHDSHKCNIVYSLFKTSFIKEAFSIQSISNDLVLGAVIVSMGRGKLLEKAFFVKRFKLYWAGLLNPIFRIYRKDTVAFQLIKQDILNRFGEIFPEYIEDIERLYKYYYLYSYNEKYQIHDTY